MNNLKLIQQMVALQNTLNQKINPEWISSRHKWSRAMWTESAECMDSTAWKWWKAQTIDLPNVKLELVDKFHFLISMAIEQSQKETDQMRIDNPKDKNIPDVMELAARYLNNGLVIGYNESQSIRKSFGIISETSSNDDLEKFRVSIENFVVDTIQYNGNIGGLTIGWAGLWSMLGLTAEDLLKEYFTKNVLNIFRQDNGYKTGEYIKDWSTVVGSKPIEDNEYATAFSNKMELSPTFPQDLTTKLTSHYLQVKAFSKIK